MTAVFSLPLTRPSPSAAPCLCEKPKRIHVRRRGHSQMESGLNYLPHPGEAHGGSRDSLAKLRQLGAVVLNAADRIENMVHVAAIRQEQALEHADGRFADLLVALQLLEAFSIGL